MSRTRPGLGLTTAMAVSLIAPRAAASPGFTAELKTTLELFYEPPCSLCHDGGDAATPTGRDGGAPADTPFSRALERRGLAPDDASSLERALSRARADSTDSDGDGARDLDELAWGGNPNVAALPSEPPPPPREYGCAVALGGERPSSTGAFLLLFAILRARRATPRPRPLRDSDASRGRRCPCRTRERKLR